MRNHAFLRETIQLVFAAASILAPLMTGVLLYEYAETGSRADLIHALSYLAVEGVFVWSWWQVRKGRDLNPAMRAFTAATLFVQAFYFLLAPDSAVGEGLIPFCIMLILFATVETKAFAMAYTSAILGLYLAALLVRATMPYAKDVLPHLEPAFSVFVPAVILALISAVSLRLTQFLKNSLVESQRLAEELQRRNEDLMDYSHAASHDLREPLRTIGSFTQLLNDRMKDRLNEQEKRYMGFIVTAVKRQERLIDDLLTYSRIGYSEAELARTDLSSLVASVLEDVALRVDETKAEVTVESLPQLRVAPSLMRLVFQNLISNALKFRGDEPPRIRVAARRTDEGWLVSVKDNGIGIDPIYRERIFGLFKRLHTAEEYEGSGLGLAICQKIVQHHGGRIWVESQPGQGSTFFFVVKS